ncbi:unnamed protein product [Cylindrotheca closterium]|uniref:Uncharacterized protein n=1 Tax=Cylindrotheca closterium TaxID=2856 RepID=A0AAD2PV59_9STRA|nr:unnamed protein product [Cylindrotheca closterium]
MTDYFAKMKAAKQSPVCVVTVAADGLSVNARASLGEDYEGTRQSVFSDLNVVGGVGVGGAGSALNVGGRTKTSVGKPSDKKTLFHLKDAPGATICCVSVSFSSGGQKACGENKDPATNCEIASHRSLKPIDKLQFPALYCRCKKLGRGGETFFWDSLSYVTFSELPPDNTAPWLTAKETKADWTSKIIDLRSSNATKADSIEGWRKLKVEEDDNSILRNSFTPVKREKSVTGSESSYKFVGEKGVKLAAPDFSEETPTMSALKKNDTSMASDNGLYRSALLEIKSDLDELNKFVNSSDTRTLNRLTGTILKVNALTLAANTFGRRIGEGSEFENIAGYSTMYDGLLGLYRDHKSRVEERTANFQASIDLVEHGSQHALAVVDTKVDIMGTAVQGNTAGNLETRNTLEVSMGSLCNDILPAIVGM